MYSKNNLHEACEKIGSAPSVLLEALAILPGKDCLAITPAALALLNGAFQHCKCIGWAKAPALVAVCGPAGADDEGFCTLAAAASVQTFADACKTMRRWAREALFQL